MAALILTQRMRTNPQTSTREESLSRGLSAYGTLKDVEKSPDNELKAHVERLLARAGYNATSAATAVGLNPHYLRQWLSGRVRNPGTQKLRLVAELIGVSLEELTTPGMDPASNQIGVRVKVRSGAALPVRYVVQAGAWFEVDEAAQERIASPPVAADPSYPNDVQWLELVRGDSADLFYPEGSFVHVVDAIAIGYAPQHEDFVVIERRRQQGGLIERSLKQIAVKRRKIELWPRSRNPRWNAPLDLKPDESGGDDTVVEISALVIGGYLPARRLR